VITLAVGVAVGFAALLLTYGFESGLGYSILIFLMLGALFVVARTQRLQPPRSALVLLIPISFFAVMLTVRASPLLRDLNLVALGGLALLLVVYFPKGNVWQQTIFEYAINAFVAGIEVLVRPVAEFVGAWGWFVERSFHWKRFMPVLRGLLITIPLIVVFVALFSAADEVFSRLVSRVLNSLFPRNLANVIPQAVYVVCFAWLAVGGISLALVQQKTKRAEIAEKLPSSPLRALFRLGATEALMALGGVCAVFVAFVVIQFVYLFGGEHNIVNYSYADYVHRGFTELVIVAVLTLILVFTLNETTERKTTLRENLFRGLSTILIALTGVILVSAFQRMRLYELTYGFTTLRLQIYVFIICLGFLFAGFTLSLYWRPTALNVFGACALLAAMGFVGTLDLLNPDAFVAAQNIARGDIDPLYLDELSYDAVPLLVTLVDAPEPGLRTVIRRRLYDQLWQLKDNNGAIRGFNLGRAQALTALQSVSDKLGAPSLEAPTVDAFKTYLRQGMTVREVARQFGRPFSISGNLRYNERDVVDFFYMVKGTDKSEGIRLTFDTSEGLMSACFTARSECISLSP
jgi:hypothetical protein